MTEVMRELAHKIDIHVGARVRIRRAGLGMTQEQLATALSVSHQQIQKYEAGTNSVSAGRLHDLAECLGVEVDFFFDGLDESPAIKKFAQRVHAQAAHEVASNFLTIPNEDEQAAIASLLRALKDHQHG